MAIYGKNRTLLREGGYDCSITPLDCMIESVRTDYDIFETVIDNDFTHAYSEAGMLYITEDDEEKKDGKTKKSIFTRIKEFFQTIWNAIKGLFGKAKDKCKEASENCKELYKKSGKDVREKGVGKKIKTKYDAKVYTKNLDNVLINNYQKDIDKYVETVKDAMDSCSNADDFENKVKGDREEFKTNLENYQKIIDDAFKEKENEEEVEMTQEMINNICNNIQNGLDQMSKILESNFNQSDATIKRVQKIADMKANARESEPDSENEDEKKAAQSKLDVYNAASKALTNIGESLSKKWNMETNAMTKLFGIHRSAFSELASLCSEKKEESKEEKKQEAAMMGMLSDIYMEQAFCFY